MSENNDPGDLSQRAAAPAETANTDAAIDDASPPAEVAAPARPRPTFEEGDPVSLVDKRGRDYLLILEPGKITDVNGNKIPHDIFLGRSEGFMYLGSAGQRFWVFRPGYRDYCRRMTRSNTIIYPKDAAMIITWGDIYPGATVVEAGIGSGALTIALLRAVGPTGRVISYDVNQGSINRAKKNIKAYMKGIPYQHITHLGSIYDGILERDVDRVVLDLPEPWQVVEHAAEALRPGGIYVAYSPSIIQVQQTAEAIKGVRAFVNPQTLEVLKREWMVRGARVRPDFDMVGHTGFLTFARLVNFRDVVK